MATFTTVVLFVGILLGNVAFGSAIFDYYFGIIKQNIKF